MMRVSNNSNPVPGRDAINLWPNKLAAVDFLSEQ